MNQQAIGVFDSGIGGRTVFNAIHQVLPNENLVYLQDGAHFPYGNKNKEQIVKYTVDNIYQLLKYDVKAIVIACHTASSFAMEKVKKEFDQLVIDMITPTLAWASKVSSELMVLATEGTINSEAYPRLARQLYPHVKIKCLPCPLLAPLVESGQFQKEISKEIIASQLEKAQGAKTIILGCTHYAVIKTQIATCLPQARVLDPRWAVARELEKELTKRDWLNKEEICA